MEPCCFKHKWFSSLDYTLFKLNKMPQNKLKQKVESLTKVVQALIKEVQMNASICEGTLEAFKIHVGEEDFKKIIEELKDRDKRNVEQKLEKRD